METIELKPQTRKPVLLRITDKESYLQTALWIARKICRDAIWHNDCCTWITHTTDQDAWGNSTLLAKTMSDEIYSGISGVALFLLSVLRVKKDPIIEKILRGCLKTVMIRKNKQYSSGFFSGNMGVAYVCIEAGRLLEDETITGFGLAELQKIKDKPESEYRLDIIDGCAGEIPVLIYLNSILPNENLKPTIVKMGNFLLKNAQKSAEGLSWETMEGVRNLTGFAHGVAGIAHALLDMYHFTQDKTYLDAAHAGFSYENHWFDKEQANWPDFRSDSPLFNTTNKIPQQEENICACAWCHGAPGIGLSRLKVYALTKKETYYRDALNAITTTYDNQSFHQSYSLCHGSAGNADLYIEIASILNKKEWLLKAENLGQSIQKALIEEKRMLINGLHNDLEIYDFMLGLSGLGYFFLRLYDHKKFPSVLSLNF